MEPILERALTLGIELALAGMAKQEVDGLVAAQRAAGKTDEEIYTFLRQASAAKSAEIRAEAAAQKGQP